MKVQVNGEDLPYLGYSITESYDLFSAILVLTTVVDLKGNDVSFNDTLFTPQGTEVTPNGNIYTLYPKKYVDLLAKSFPIVDKVTTFESLLKELGIEFVARFKTNSTYWCFPQLKLKSLWSQFADRPITPGGGGIIMSFNASGLLNFTDLKKAFNSEPMGFLGKLTSFRTNTDWISNTHGKWDIVNHSIESDIETETFTLTELAGKGTVMNVCLNTESLKQMKETLTNQYNKKYYTSTVAKYEGVKMDGVPFLGCTLQDLNTKAVYVLYAMTVAGNDQGQTMNISVVRKP